MAETVGDAVARSLEAYARLVELGEAIDDEWSYVNDLADSWRERLAETGDRRSSETLAPETSTALDLAIAEIELITDPHRAIDWLSTFPQVVIVALHEAP